MKREIILDDDFTKKDSAFISELVLDALIDAELSDQMREQIQDDIVTRYDGLPDSLISNLCQAVVDFE
jgi:hypothetical protein